MEICKWRKSGGGAKGVKGSYKCEGGTGNVQVRNDPLPFKNISIKVMIQLKNHYLNKCDN